MTRQELFNELAPRVCAGTSIADVILDEIISLRQQLHDAEESNKAVERALADVDYRGTYADGVLYLKQQVAAALAACEAKDAALAYVDDEYDPSTGITLDR